MAAAILTHLYLEVKGQSKCSRQFEPTHLVSKAIGYFEGHESMHVIDVFIIKQAKC